MSLPFATSPKPVAAALAAMGTGGAGVGQFLLRFEDVSQCGRVRLEVLTAGLDVALWTDVLPHHPLAMRFAAEGIVPIRTRLRIMRRAALTHAAAIVSTQGTFVLCTDGQTVYLNSQGELAVTAAAHTQVSHGTAAQALGEVFVEHTLARPAAPPGKRRVTELPKLAGEAADLTLAPYAPVDSAAWIQTAQQAPLAAVQASLRHTDANAHVNSLAYVTWFEEQVAAKLWATHGQALVADAVEIAYLRPSFAGETLDITADEAAACTEIATLAPAQTLCVSGSFVGPDGKLRARIQMHFTR